MTNAREVIFRVLGKRKEGTFLLPVVAKVHVVADAVVAEAAVAFFRLVWESRHRRWREITDLGLSSRFFSHFSLVAERNNCFPS